MIRTILAVAAGAYAVYAFTPRKLTERLRAWDRASSEKHAEKVYAEMCLNFGVDPDDPNPEALTRAVELDADRRHEVLSS